MGRRIPDDNNLSLIHPVVYFSLFAIGLAASVGIMTTMCSVRFRRKQSAAPASSDQVELSKESDICPLQSQAEQPQVENTETEDNDVGIKELPLPPAMQVPKDSLPSGNLKRAITERRTSFSLSMKMPRTLSVVRKRDHEEEEEKERDNIKGKLKAGDSVWMKTIILGDKCVPGEEDPVIYEGRGKRISAYHPKNSSSISISRQCSFLHTNAHSLSQPLPKEEIVNNT